MAVLARYSRLFSSLQAVLKLDHSGVAGQSCGGVRKISTLDFSAPLSIQNSGPSVVTVSSTSNEKMTQCTVLTPGEFHSKRERSERSLLGVSSNSEAPRRSLSPRSMSLASRPDAPCDGEVAQ